ncbi:ComEA family DNA-binding protein [Paenibacillus sp. sgz500958]|uniref:ComEA family DNA-binding protein n=1 Tax=Paenibacillus sp. sgz500958 TaxID=3242475 RepID=UPI0036D3188A
MKRLAIIGGIAAALAGIGLLWYGNEGRSSGIAGWETMNVGVETALAGSGQTSSEQTSSQGGIEGGNADRKDKTANSDTSTTEKSAESGSKTAGTVIHEGDAAATLPTKGSATSVTTPVNHPPGSSSDAAVNPIESQPQNQPAGAEGKINVNTATLEQLKELPGIGDAKARAIMDYRSSQGPFASLTELGKVKGIGPKLLEKLKPMVLF